MDNADPLMAANHEVRTYKEYQVYVPWMELGLSQPLFCQRVCLSPLTKGGVGGVPIPMTGEKA